MNKKENLGELKVQLDNRKTDVISNILSREGFNTLNKFIQLKVDRAKENTLKDVIVKIADLSLYKQPKMSELTLNALIVYLMEKYKLNDRKEE